MANTKKMELGTWIQINSSTVVEILGFNGFDFVVIDLEHGNISLESLENLIRAAEVSGLTSLVRVYENNAALIMKVLDLGPSGLMVPQISSKEDALKMVEYARYPPHGKRGSCPCIREAKHWDTEWTNHMVKSNKQTKLIALVEGEEGVNNFQEIVDIEGIDSYMIGPFDLSVSLGIPGQIKNSAIEEKYIELIDITKKRNKEFIGVDFSYESEEIQKSIQVWKDRGISMLTIGIDKMFITKAAREVSQFNQKN